MRPITFLIVFLLASTAFAQCPGGTCTRPVKQTTKSVLKSVTKTVEVAKTKVVQRPRFRLFKRWR